MHRFCANIPNVNLEGTNCQEKLKMPYFNNTPAFEEQTKTTYESKHNENLSKITLNPFSSVQQQAAGIKNA